MGPAQLGNFAKHLLKSRYWLKDKSGYYSDGRLCVKVHAPDRPYLFIDPSGFNEGRYVAPLG